MGAYTIGSSPLVKSRQVDRHAADVGLRFIPTRVGQTIASLSLYSSALGSSPRVWGRPCARATPTRCRPVHPHTCRADVGLPRLALVAARFIPTRVGQTARSTATTATPPVHPHACGADSWPCSADGGWWRFIPTRVGQTVPITLGGACRLRFIPTRVGQTGAKVGGHGFTSGSSPRVWGRPADLSVT